MIATPSTTLSTELGPDDAFFLINGAQVDYLKATAGDAFNEITLLPLSLKAYSAALQLSHPRIFNYLPLIDFAACQQDYHDTCLQLSEKWLSSMGLRCEINGIDLEELDAPAQFLFFLHIRQIERLARTIILQNPAVRTFHMMAGEPMLPAYFDFDSDVGAAVVQYVCETMGRSFRRAASPPLSALRLPPSLDISELPIDMPAFPLGEKPRFGMSLGMTNAVDDIVGAFDDLSYESVLLASEMWGAPRLSRGSSAIAMFRSIPLFPHRKKETDWATELRQLYEEVIQRLPSSPLPESMKNNRHMLFQIDHIINRRWLKYTDLIERAGIFVKQCPLDFFAHSDLFTEEGSILSRLYKNAGTTIFTVPHAPWPVGPGLQSSKSTDVALAWSKSSAHLAKRILPDTEVCPTGKLGRSISFILPQSDDPELVRLKEFIGGKKVVLLLINALEWNAFPYEDLATHFNACRELGNIPKDLHERVVILIRPKPSILGDNPILYTNHSGFDFLPHPDLTLVNLATCLKIADCVVGIDLPTSAYWDVLENKVPLIHFKPSDIIDLQHSFPEDIVKRFSNSAQLWNEIRSVLFDAGHRELTIALQQAFFIDDHQPGYPTDLPSLQYIFRT